MTTGKHTIKRMESLNEFITLDDNSHWQVDSISERSTIRGWGTGAEIIVETYISTKYKFTHPLKKETIKAIQLK